MNTRLLEVQRRSGVVFEPHRLHEKQLMRVAQFAVGTELSLDILLEHSIYLVLGCNSCQEELTNKVVSLGYQLHEGQTGLCQLIDRVLELAAKGITIPTRTRALLTRHVMSCERCKARHYG